jgi:hypothetical protein
MFSGVPTTTPPSTSPLPVVVAGAQDAAAGALPVARVGNVDVSQAPQGLSPRAPSGSSQAEAVEPGEVLSENLIANRRLRSAVAFSQVMHVLVSEPAAPDVAVLQAVARELEEVVRMGTIPAISTLIKLNEMGCGSTRTPISRAALFVGLAVVSDNENATSLDKLPNDCLHIAQAVVLALQTSSSLDSRPDFAAAVGELAACDTLVNAEAWLKAWTQGRISAMPEDKAPAPRESLESARLYLTEIISNPGKEPNRFPVASPWAEAVDSFYR